MHVLKDFFTLLISLYSVVATEVTIDDNTYFNNVTLVKYTNFGASGTYSVVTQVSPCAKTSTSYAKAPSAPLDEEVTVAVRGPIQLKAFAAYAPSSSSDTKHKRDTRARRPHAHRHAHLHQEQKRETTSGDWQQVGSYDAAGPTASGIVFLKNPKYNSVLKFMGADGVSLEEKDPQKLNDVLVPSNEEFTIWTDKPCSGEDASSDCGYSRPNTRAYHGWGGGSKAFLFEFSMPDDQQDVQPTKMTNPNMPAIWLLNSLIPRTGQYDCSCHPECGELDIFEALSNTEQGEYDSSEMMTSHFYNLAQNVGTGNWMQRPVDWTMKGIVIMEDFTATLALLPEDFEIGATLTSEQRSSVASGSAAAGSATAQATVTLPASPT